jgi:uncharacterized protein YgiM (DUF1202 family)
MRKPLLAFGLVALAGAALTSGPAFAASPSGTSGSYSASKISTGTSVTGADVVAYAERFQGYPYTTVGNSPATGFSCIGFVSYVYQSLGINLPDDLGGAYGFALQIPFADLEPGDVLYFQNTVWYGLSHTAIYIGDGRMIHAEWYNRGVVISSFTNDPIDGNYWTEHYLGANRPWGATAVAVPLATPVPQVPAPPVSPQAQSVTQPATQQTVTHVAAGPRATVRVSGLNVRLGPSLRARVATVLLRGAHISLLGHRSDWYRVQLSNGSRGWVVGQGIRKKAHGLHRVTAVRHTTRRVAARRTPVKRATRRVAHRPTLTVAVSGLRVRARPGLAAPVVGSLGRGARVSILGRYANWVRVAPRRGRSGWISRSFVRMPATRHAATSRVTAVRAATTTTTRKTIPVNVRSTAALSSPILSLIVPGRRYAVLGTLYGWTHVRLASGITGWADSSVLAAAGSRATATTTRRGAATAVLTAGVRLHYGAGVTRPTIRLVAAGTHVRVIGTTASGWDRLRLPSGQTGYVLGAYVQS